MKNSQKDTETRGNAELIHFEAERFRSNSVDYIIGVDEAGRGPLAGPVVAASCCFVGDPKESMNISEIRDSKLITDEKERERRRETHSWARCNAIFSLNVWHSVASWCSRVALLIPRWLLTHM